MAVFRYSAKDSTGRVIAGTIEADNDAVVVDRLREMGFFITNLERAQQRRDVGDLLQGMFGVGLKDLAIFSRQFSTMVNAGLSLVRVLSILEQQTSNKKLREVAAQVRLDVEAGRPLSEALARHPKVFSSLYVNMVKAGETGGVLDSPFLSGIVAIIFLMFLIPGLAYGIATGSIRKDSDVIEAMGKTMSTLGVYIVLVFFAAQFVAFFGWTHLGIITAIKGASLLKAAGLTGIPLMVAFVVVAAFMNLFMGSASAKWAILAPVFVPMFMLLGYTPELTQAAYRIGDSATNVITPMMSYFALIVAFAQKYDKNAGIGTIIAMMLPYSVALLVTWGLMLVLWMLAGWPVGPGAGLYLAR
ncbi:MAG: AbgT family transporter [Bryobacteraceae bacterium]|nr:AbgT family transporter [Bryobacteraceae bacterium]